MSTQSLHFWTTGEDYTNLLKGFFSEGRFHTFMELIKDAGMDFEHTKKCFLLQFELTGSTKDGGDLSVNFFDESPADFKEILWTAIKTCVNPHLKKGYFDEEYDEYVKERDYEILDVLLKEHLDIECMKDLYALFEYIPADEIILMLKEEILEDCGFKLYKDLVSATWDRKETVTGAILQDGTFVECSYQGHIYLLPVLNKMKLMKWDGRYDENIVRISSNSVAGGNVGHALSNISEYMNEDVNDKIIKTVWDASNYIDRFYSSTGKRSVGYSAVNLYSVTFGKGKKYGNLRFLKDIATELFSDKIKLVNFSLDPNDINSDEVFIRTSPRKSMAGLLNSVTRFKDDIEDGIIQIQSDYLKVEDVIQNNELHWFFQDFIQGYNGVANMDYYHERTKTGGDFVHLGINYSNMISANQGDVVAGKNTQTILDWEQSRILENFMKKIVKKVRCKIQVEFVLDSENVIHIVQLRLFENEVSTVDAPKETVKGFLVLGLTFNSAPWSSHGVSEINTEDILIVDSEADSKDLIGKKALIVKDNVDFSHILALSIALNIPSMFCVQQGNIEDIKKFKKVKFNTNYREAFVHGIE